MAPVHDFPFCQQDKGENEQAPCIRRSDKHKRCEHHGIIPVVNAAAAAAFVLHEPRLKRTEKQNTGHIADRIHQADEDQNSLVKNAREVKRADYGVKPNPNRRHQERCFCTGAGHRFSTACRWHEVAGKLFLAAHAFKLGRKEAENHFDRKNKPYQTKDDWMVLKPAKKRIGTLDPIHNVNACGCEKQAGSIGQFHIM